MYIYIYIIITDAGWDVRLTVSSLDSAESARRSSRETEVEEPVREVLGYHYYYYHHYE